MLEENNVVVPAFFDAKLLPYPCNSSNQLQLFGTGACNVETVNYIEGRQSNPIFQPHKRGRDVVAASREQRHQIPFNHNISYVERKNPIKGHVSTGLKLSYEDDERNSSITCATASMNPSPSIFSSLRDNIRIQFDQQNVEFDRYIKTQEIHMMKGVREMKQRHVASLMTAIEKTANKKIREKDIELEKLQRKSVELVQRIKLAAAEAQNWEYRAKYNESVVNTLKTNLEQALLQSAADKMKEGFGDSEIDDTASCIKHHKKIMACRWCKKNEVRIVIMPCKHLCLCLDCQGLVNVCPVCQIVKTASLEVVFS